MKKLNVMALMIAGAVWLAPTEGHAAVVGEWFAEGCVSGTDCLTTGGVLIASGYVRMKTYNNNFDLAECQALVDFGDPTDLVAHLWIAGSAACPGQFLHVDAKGASGTCDTNGHITHVVNTGEPGARVVWAGQNYSLEEPNPGPNEGFAYIATRAIGVQSPADTVSATECRATLPDPIP